MEWIGLIAAMQYDCVTPLLPLPLHLLFLLHLQLHLLHLLTPYLPPQAYQCGITPIHWAVIWDCRPLVAHHMLYNPHYNLPTTQHFTCPELHIDIPKGTTPFGLAEILGSFHANLLKKRFEDCYDTAILLHNIDVITVGDIRSTARRLQHLAVLADIKRALHDVDAWGRNLGGLDGAGEEE